jgi:hypothetical protein
MVALSGAACVVMESVSAAAAADLEGSKGPFAGTTRSDYEI